jgi:hypothetical protein
VNFKAAIEVTCCTRIKVLSGYNENNNRDRQEQFLEAMSIDILPLKFKKLWGLNSGMRIEFAG